MKSRYINYLILFMIVTPLLFISSYIYVYMYNRIVNMVNIGYFIPFYRYDISIFDEFDDIYNSIILFFKEFSFETLKSILTVCLQKFIIIIPIVLVIFEIFVFLKVFLIVYLKLSYNPSYKTSIFSQLLIKFVLFLKTIILNFINFFNKKKNFYLILLLFISGLFEVFVFESLIFLIDYVSSMINFTSHLLLLDIVKFLIVMIIRFIRNFNPIVVFLLFLLFYFLIAKSLAWKKIRINWAVFKRFVGDLGTLTIVNGAPGTGKTLSIVQMSLAQEELMLEANRDVLVQFELYHPSINFSIVRFLLKFYFLDCDEKDFNLALSKCPNLFMYEERLRKYMESPISENYFRIFYRNTAIVSSIGIYDPYFESMSRKADMSSFRLFKKQSSMFHEADEIIVLPEFDKEFSSHDSKAEVSEDGTSGFFAIFSHISERSGKVFIDYQDRQQAIRRIRSIAMTYIQLDDRKVRMPFMLNIIYFPFVKLLNSLLKLVNYYLIKSVKTEKKWTVRKIPLQKYKRNDVSLFYQFLKYFTFLIMKITEYFEHFRYFRIIGQRANNDDFKDAKVFKYNLNMMDFFHLEDQKIYESIQFKRFYSDLRKELYAFKGIKQSLVEIEKWSSIDPAAAEYMKLNQRFYSKIINAQLDDNMRVREGNE